MSRQNVEIAKRATDAFNRRDFDSYDDLRVEGRGRSSGVPVAGRETVICDFRGEKVSRIRNHLDHCEALKAAGLEG